MDDVEDLGRRLLRFVEAREWERFHTPRSLALALTGEVGELVSEMQWKTDAELVDGSAELRKRLGDEIADVLIYLIRLSQVCGIDPVAEAHAKVTRNEERYPVEWARGSAAKYTERERP